MQLKFDKPKIEWAFTKGNRADVRDDFRRKPPKVAAWPGETIERVLVTVARAGSVVLTLSQQDLCDLMLAVQRGYGWSDIHDNAKAYGAAWEKTEGDLLLRLKALEKRLVTVTRIPAKRGKPARKLRNLTAEEKRMVADIKENR